MSMSDSGDSLIAELITKDVQAEFDCTVRAPYEYPDSDSDDDAPDTTKLKMPKMHVYKVCVKTKVRSFQPNKSLIGSMQICPATRGGWTITRELLRTHTISRDMTFTFTGPKQLTGIIQKRAKKIGKNIAYRVWVDDNTQEDVKMIDMKFRDEQLIPPSLYRKLSKKGKENK